MARYKMIPEGDSMRVKIHGKFFGEVPHQFIEAIFNGAHFDKDDFNNDYYSFISDGKELRFQIGGNVYCFYENLTVGKTKIIFEPTFNDYFGKDRFRCFIINPADISWSLRDTLEKRGVPIP